MFSVIGNRRFQGEQSCGEHDAEGVKLCAQAMRTWAAYYRPSALYASVAE